MLHSYICFNIYDGKGCTLWTCAVLRGISFSASFGAEILRQFLQVTILVNECNSTQKDLPLTLHSNTLCFPVRLGRENHKSLSYYVTGLPFQWVQTNQYEDKAQLLISCMNVT